MDAMTFFHYSAGKWLSHRTTHHLAFRRSELGSSEIQVEPLAADHPDIIALCKLHEIDPQRAIGGAHVTWQGSMDWDREDDGPHAGETVFALVPDPDNPTQGQLLRERGYAEIVPVVGQYQIDADGGLVMTTEYETMSSVERFWFAGPNLRLRTSTVKRFGGFSTASFCAETRLVEVAEVRETTIESPQTAVQHHLSLLGW
ncbi:MAG: phycobiliprotein lyase [Leptodesmis sp.]|uniref:phycobiliprotein lyase n=1 Tax=Leptodesmis sp. TaxID=3100501 RepID=UPI003D134BDC